jgi:hypothetical protein
VVFFAFGDFIFAPPFFFHACTASVFCFLWWFWSSFLFFFCAPFIFRPFHGQSRELFCF